MLVLLSLCSLLAASQAFHLAPRAPVSRRPLILRSAEEDISHESSFLERILAFLMGALPEAMTPLTTAMDETKIVKNPPKWVKPSTVSDLRRAHKKDSFWAKQDIIDHFAERYLPEVKPGEIQVLVKDRDVYISYPDAIAKEIEELEHNPIEVAEKFIAEGVEAAVAPIDKPMNQDNVVKTPKAYTKPVQLSKLRKTLQKNPDYFK